MQAHTRAVAGYYDAHSVPLYQARWSPSCFHFGLFDGEPVQGPQPPASALLRMIDETVKGVELGPDRLVVDAGCGVGGASIHLAQRTGCRVVGLSISEVQLDLARRRAAEAGVEDRVRFVHADCDGRLPFEHDSVACVLTMESVCHFSERDAFFRECARILEPGGVVVSEDWVAAEDLDDEAIGALITPLCEAWHVPGLDTVRAFAGRLAGAGLTVERAEQLEAGTEPNLAYLLSGVTALRLAHALGRALGPDDPLWLAQLSTLHRGWRAGAFGLGVLRARKPIGG